MMMRILDPGSRNGRNLTQEEARHAFEAILSGGEDEIAIAAFLVAVKCKGMSTEELTGFALAARDQATFPCVDTPGLVCVSPPHDGYEGLPPMEVAAGLVAAAAGSRVLILAGRGVPPRRGLTAANVLEALDAHMTWDPQEAESWVNELGFAACAVGGMLPAIVNLRQVRGGVSVRTPLSTVEKLMAPPGASVLLGAQEGPVLGAAVEVIQAIGHPRGIALQGPEGSVIPRLRRRTRGIELDGSHLAPLTVEPDDFGLGGDVEPELPMFGPPEIGQGTSDNPALVQACGAITKAVLSGETGPARNATLLTAALILKVSRRCMTVAEGVDAAARAMDSGAGLALLDKLRKIGE
jgi:anthranilate phosphoribosyltransferase